MDQEPQIDWRQPTPDDEVRKETDYFLGLNTPLRNQGDGQRGIMGFPVGEPDPFGVGIHQKALQHNPNNIGLHTTERPAELGFEGTQQAERLFIAMVADIMDADLQMVDGYTEAGGTTANMAGLLIGRNRTHLHNAKGEPVKNCKNSTAVLCSHLTHYSVQQNASNLGIGEIAAIDAEDATGVHWLGTDENGHVLLSQLEKFLQMILSKTTPRISNIIVVGNAGTTMLGSVDDIPKMSEMIGDFKRQYPETIFHFHVDAAHGGLLAPFYGDMPRIGFSNEHVDTMTIDPHKMGGVGFGCGVILARKGLFDWMKHEAPYVPGDSRTVIGSRPGAIAVSAYATFRHLGRDGMEKKAQHIRQMTHDIRSRLAQLGITMFDSDLNVIAMKSSLPATVESEFIFHGTEKMPRDMGNPNNAERQTITNIVVMSHVEEHMENFERQYKKWLEQ